jgi:ATPase subunit of ABC transporter with duplicated ATPase domains
MSTHHSIQLKDITLKFEDKTVFSSISATIHDRDRIAIIGPNGAGKSSLLKAIMRDSQVHTTGEWYLRIGYLDQFYGSIMRYTTPLDAIEQLMPPSYS